MPGAKLEYYNKHESFITLSSHHIISWIKICRYDLIEIKIQIIITNLSPSNFSLISTLNAPSFEIRWRTCSKSIKSWWKSWKINSSTKKKRRGRREAIVLLGRGRVMVLPFWERIPPHVYLCLNNKLESSQRFLLAFRGNYKRVSMFLHFQLVASS